MQGPFQGIDEAALVAEFGLPYTPVREVLSRSVSVAEEARVRFRNRAGATVGLSATERSGLGRSRLPTVPSPLRRGSCSPPLFKRVL